MPEILIIEDDTKLRSQIDSYLKTQGFETTAVGEGRQGFSTFKDYGCDTVVLDVRLPDLKGTELLKSMTEAFAFHPPIIIITGHGDKALAIEALRLGAFDFLEKPFSPQALKSSIDRALTQKKQDIDGFRGLFESMGHNDLTHRESEVAALAADGLSNEAIASKLSIGSETVKTHLKNVFRKFGVDNRTLLAARLRKR